MTQKNVIHRGSFQFQLISEYSKAETFKNCWQPLNYLFIGYNSVKKIITNLERRTPWPRPDFTLLNYLDSCLGT